jgi:hypothetical protein
LDIAIFYRRILDFSQQPCFASESTSTSASATRIFILYPGNNAAARIHSHHSPVQAKDKIPGYHTCGNGLKTTNGTESSGTSI